MSELGNKIFLAKTKINNVNKKRYNKNNIEIGELLSQLNSQINQKKFGEKLKNNSNVHDQLKKLALNIIRIL